MPKLVPLYGKQFGEWTVISQNPVVKNRRTFWACRCSCGQEKLVQSVNLRSEGSTNCGCKRQEALMSANLRHGYARRGDIKPEHQIWRTMRQRCSNPRDPKYPVYGGRGIQVCDRWKNSFSNFIADMGPRPSPKYSIHRLDNDGHYELGNCKWATAEEQTQGRGKNGYSRWILLIALIHRPIIRWVRLDPRWLDR